MSEIIFFKIFLYISVISVPSVAKVFLAAALSRCVLRGEKDFYLLPKIFSRSAMVIFNKVGLP